ncbi:prepilin peptidase [Arthrobacter sp. fls2-241-R2A-200]|uniref:prepilin peptidase n=1 Tax=Arthrobacter sp. fls2-241-R2A-200 TaxID=3040281 RepID=UPI00254E44F7|nr:prepilin peptidase [Arthrobacter sp. fls2-241-R2A-200]
MIRRLSDLWDASPLGFWLVAAACLYFLAMAVRLTVIDVRSHLLPNRIVFPSYAVAGALLLAAAVVGFFGGTDGTSRLGVALFGVPGLRVLAGGAALWLFYFVLRVIHPPGMGFGDVKLAGVLGLYLGYLGWNHVMAATFAAFLLGGLWSLAILAARRGTLRSAIPFGPFMLAGAALAMAVLPA